MDISYFVTDDRIEIQGLDLAGWRHKNSVYLGSFYVKELSEDKGKLYATIEAGDKTFVNYRDSIHGKRVGWKTPLVDLVSSFMKVAYLVSRGVIYQPLEDPENFIYNVNKQRLQVVGRYDSTIRYIDGDFLDWVLEVIGFTISQERPNQFGYLTHKEYYDNMDEEHQELYKGYLECKDFQSLVEYTLEPSVIGVLKEYVPITRLPIDNKPTIREVLERSVEEKQKQLEEERERRSTVEDLEVGNTGDMGEDVDLDRKKSTKPKKIRQTKEYSKEDRMMQQDKIDEYRRDLGIPEDRDDDYPRKRSSGVVSTLLSLAFLAFTIWLAWEFYTWLF